MAVKVCGGCKRSLEETSFHKSSKTSDGLQSQCKECTRAHQKRWLERRPEKVAEYREASRVRMVGKYATDEDHRETVRQRVRDWRAKVGPEHVAKIQRKQLLKREYSMTLEQFEAMLATQKGVCALCGKDGGKRGLSVDHDHDTGGIRGLLCTRCNVALGVIGDNIEGVQKVMEYLRKPQRNFEQSEISA